MECTELTFTLPSPIKQTFNRDLLSTPTPKFCDDEEILFAILKYIEKRLWKKLKNMPGQRVKCEKLKQAFLETYERIKKKKALLRGEEKKKTQHPYYRIVMPNRCSQEIFDRLRERSYQFR